MQPLTETPTEDATGEETVPSTQPEPLLVQGKAITTTTSHHRGLGEALTPAVTISCAPLRYPGHGECCQILLSSLCWPGCVSPPAAQLPSSLLSPQRLSSDSINVVPPQNNTCLLHVPPKPGRYAGCIQTPLAASLALSTAQRPHAPITEALRPSCHPHLRRPAAAGPQPTLRSPIRTLTFPRGPSGSRHVAKTWVGG